MALKHISSLANAIPQVEIGISAFMLTIGHVHSHLEIQGIKEINLPVSKLVLGIP